MRFTSLDWSRAADGPSRTLRPDRSAPATPTQAAPMPQPSREHALGVDARQRGRLAVLGGGLEREAGLGAADEPVEPREGGEGARAGHELRQAEEEPGDRDPALRERALDTRKSTSQTAWAAERRNTASPKVAKVWASIGASRIQRMRP